MPSIDSGLRYFRRHTDMVVLEGLFGPPYKSQDRRVNETRHLSQLNTMSCIKASTQTFNVYEDEIQYLINHEQRNNFIKNLTRS